VIRKTEKGWLADILIGGRGGKRTRKLFKTKGEAKRFEAHKLNVAIHEQPWNKSETDKRRLSTLCQLWYKLHGHSLRDGSRRLQMLLNTCLGMGDPMAIKFTSKDFAHYRQSRLSGDKPVSANTVNHEQAYLRAVFNELAALGEWRQPNPLKGLRKLRHPETELLYLTPEQIERLLSELQQCRTDDAYQVSRLCLATGGRWGEVENLKHQHCLGGKVVFENPKDAERRAVPVSPDLLSAVLNGRGPDRLFTPCYGAFRSAVKRAGLQIPKGQLTHVLRHTFASHFMQNGGNILTLQRVLGHSDLKMTMRYAHLAPDHLEEVLTLNPLYCWHIVGNEKGPNLADRA
jgi:integrase